MKQLTGIDNMFLFSEQSNNFMHVGNLSIYDVSTAPGGKVRFKDILKHYEDRIYLNSLFRHRLVSVPFDIDRPYWVADSDIDVEFHIRHIALPKPGDWRQLMIQVARLHSLPLDRAHPLWEVYVIEGLDNIPNLPAGAFAVFTKLHHASVDGMASLLLWDQLHSATPTTEAPKTSHQAILADRAPSTLEFLSRALVNTANRVLEAGKLSAQVASKTVELGMEQIGELLGKDKAAGGIKPPSGWAPATRFGKAVSANRVVDGFGMPMSRIKRVRAKLPGVTLNDIFLSVSGGAVRRYLQSKGELPQQSLVANMPITLRSDASAGGNNVGATTVRVRTDIEDELKRLSAVHLEALASKHQVEKVGPALLANLVDNMPSAISGLLNAKLMLPSVNLTVSNIRGPDKPMYLAGAKAMCLYPISLPLDGLGLNLTGASYNGVMWVTVVCCRKMLPDPEFFIQCMKQSWDELLAAADALPAPTTEKIAGKAAKAAKAAKPVAPKPPSRAVEKPELATE